MLVSLSNLLANLAGARGWHGLSAFTLLLCAALSAQAQERMNLWGTVGPTNGWTFLSGKFTGGAKDDWFGYQPSNGTLWVGKNNGGSFSPSKFYTMSPASGWQFASGNFNGDSLEDVVGYHPSNGSLWVGISTGTAFTFTRFYLGLGPTSGWQFVAGRFTSDNVDDVIGYHPSDGSLWLGTNTGTSFQITQFDSVSPAAGWKFVAGNFAGGDALDDVAGYLTTAGSLWVGRNIGTTFAFNESASGFTPASGWSFDVGVLTGDADPSGNDSRTDLLAYHPSNGSLHRVETQGAVNSPQHVFTRITDAPVVMLPNSGSQTDFAPNDSTWRLVTGDFTGDSCVDAFTYLPKTGGTWVRRLGDAPPVLEGYAWPLSARPGETIKFFVSGTGSGVVKFVHHTNDAERGVVETLMPQEATFTPAPQATNNSYPLQEGKGWSESFSFALPTGAARWSSGIYSARLTNTNGERYYIPFVVKPPADSSAGRAVIVNTNTWLAYNEYRGRNMNSNGTIGVDGLGKYTNLKNANGDKIPGTGAEFTSFFVPNPKTSPVSGTLHLTRAELWLLTWLDQQGIAADVFTDIDFHKGQVTAANYHTLIVGTHPEYWTDQMFSNLSDFLDEGSSLIYMGGNGLFELAWYDESVTTNIGMHFRSLTAPATPGARPGDRYAHRGKFEFRSTFVGKPERDLLGIATANCGNRGSAYEIEDDDHALLAGLGLADGTLIGLKGLNTEAGNGMASGWEAETRNGALVHTPTGCGTPPNPEMGVHPPATFPVDLLARAEPAQAKINNQIVTVDGAEMVYYEHLGGGFVFSTGSITFIGSLIVDDGLQKIVKRALDLAAAGEP